MSPDTWNDGYIDGVEDVFRYLHEVGASNLTYPLMKKLGINPDTILGARLMRIGEGHWTPREDGDGLSS